MAIDFRKSGLEDLYVLEFLMQSYSLNEILGILNNICGSLCMRYLNPKLKYARHFNLSFFGVLARSRSLLEKMIFRAEVLRHSKPEFAVIYERLLKFDRKLMYAQKLVSDNNLKKGREEIIEAAQEYSAIFKDITDIFLNSSQKSR